MISTMDALTALRTRRSHGRLAEPAPDDDQIRVMLEAALAGPDHGELHPIRFALLRGAGLEAFGQVLEQAYYRRCEEQCEDPVPAKAEKERSKLHRAPLVIVVSAQRQRSDKIPWSDQRDAAVAAAMSILVAAHALGFGAMWRTGDIVDDPDVKLALGRSAEDAIVGFLYIGTIVEHKEPREPSLDGLVFEYPE
jgi:nitroreductase